MAFIVNGYTAANVLQELTSDFVNTFPAFLTPLQTFILGHWSDISAQPDFAKTLAQAVLESDLIEQLFSDVCKSLRGQTPAADINVENYPRDPIEGEMGWGSSSSKPAESHQGRRHARKHREKSSMMVTTWGDKAWA